MARPDPMPYRAPTPAFDTAGEPTYAAAAKEKAQAELGGQTVDDDVPEAASADPRAFAFGRRATGLSTGTAFTSFAPAAQIGAVLAYW